MNANRIFSASGAKMLAMRTNEVLLKMRSSSLAITGRDRHDHRENFRTGKTTALKERVIPMLEANRLKVSYLDLGEPLRQRFVYKDELIDALEHILSIADQRLKNPFDVFIIDDVHHAFQLKSKEPELGALSESIWTTINGKALSGSKIIFMTGYHPLSGAFDEFLRVMPACKVFLDSPIIEFSRF